MAPARTKPTKQYPFEPDYAVPPGETLRETIAAMGITQRELCARTGLSTKHVNQIIKGTAPITPDTAIRLERVTGVPAHMWNNLEANYRERLARLEQRERLQADLEWLKTIPTQELIRRGRIAPETDKRGLLEKVLQFFGVASVDAWKKGWQSSQFAFRRSPRCKGDLGAMATWLRLCELEAQAIDCRPFDQLAFRGALDEIRAMTLEDAQQFVPALKRRCAEAGVAVVLVPQIRGAAVNGAAKWLTPTKAMIGLSLRGKWNDIFWFTFFHEAGHLLKDSKKETFIDVAYADDPREQAANRFAETILIPPGREPELSRLRSYAAVRGFAQSIGIAPGIVVGRLQREGIIPYSHLNRLKTRLEWNAG